jgi:hypothetical protein
MAATRRPDTFVFASASGTMTVNDMTGTDKIGLDITGGTFGTDAFAVASLSNNVNIKAVADASVLGATTLGQAGFAYQSDTGELYYKADGDFSSGAVLVGTITTNTVSPWTYDFSKITAV